MGQSPRAAGLYIEFHKTQIDIKVAQSVVSVTVAPLTCFGLPEPTEPWTCGNLQASDSAVTCGSEGPSPSGVLPQQAGLISPTSCLNSGLPNPARPELWCPVREAKRTVINWVTFVYKGGSPRSAVQLAHQCEMPPSLCSRAGGSPLHCNSHKHSPAPGPALSQRPSPRTEPLKAIQLIQPRLLRCKAAQGRPHDEGPSSPSHHKASLRRLKGSTSATGSHCN